MKLSKTRGLLVALAFCGAPIAWATPTLFQGNYIVPVPSELAEVASFPVTYTVDTDANGNTTLGYHLPPDLVTPSATPIELTQTGPAVGGFTPFRGPQGSGSCRKETSSMTCFVIYPPVQATPAQVDTYLEQTYGANDPKLSLRQKVAHAFEGDPKGIVNIPTLQ